MIRLGMNDQPAWLDLASGVRVEVLPLTTALVLAARRDPAVTALVADAQERGESVTDETATVAVTKALGRLAIVGWEGVGDEAGADAAVTPDNINALLDLWPLYEAFSAGYVAKGLILEQEKNASGRSPNGSSEGAPNTARPVTSGARTAPRH